MKHYLSVLSFALLCMSVFTSNMYAVPKVIAHRGYWKTEGSAQNSIRSLIKADSIKCYGSEFDVWITADNKLVVNHDDAINGHVIETSNSDIILSQKLANGECVPTLSDFLDAAKNTTVQLILEVKPHKNLIRENSAVKDIVKMVRKKGLEDRIEYITFSQNAMEQLIKQTKRPVYYLDGKLSPKALDRLGSAGADYHINVFKAHPEWISEAHSIGQKVNIWTVNSADGIQWCIDHNADFITTNEPELTQQMTK